jgi:hypothetical protein
VGPQLLDGPRREGPADEPAQAGVVGWIHEQEDRQVEVEHALVGRHPSMTGVRAERRVAQDPLGVGPAQADQLVPRGQ